MEVINTILVIYAALCFGFTKIVTAIPEITIHKTNYTAVSGTNVTLECIVNDNGVTITYIDWECYVNQQWFTIRKSGKYFWTIQMPSLVISNVQTSDSRLYRCLAFTKVDTAEGPAIFLNVQTKPEITVHKTNYTAVSGTSVTLECIVKDNGETITLIEWEYKVNQDWFQVWKPTKYFWTIQMPSLVILNVQKSDSNFYRCLASNRLGTAEGPAIFLNVQTIPEITVHKTNYTAVSGTNVTLECIVKDNGVTITSIEWEYNVNQQWFKVSRSPRYVWTIQKPSLVISNVQTSDLRLYRCLASTSLDTAEGPAIFLNVQTFPIVIVQSTQLVIAVGDDIVLNCIVNGNGVPVQDVKWYRRYPLSLIQLINEVKYEWSPLGLNASIIIKKAIENDTGTYVCEGTTVVGSSKGNDIELRVGYKPTVTVNKYNYSIGVEDNLTLHCSIDGHGSTIKRVEWLKVRNSQFRYLQPSTRVFWDISSPSMKINIVKLDDAGRYICYGETDFGSRTSWQISVQVFSKPIITSPNYEYKLINGTTAVLEVRIDDKMQTSLSVEWEKYKEENQQWFPLENNSRHLWTNAKPSLRIATALVHDDGKYRVIGKTAYHEVRSSPITLTIYVPVKIKELETRPVFIREGDTVEIRCLVDGRPEPKVTWKLANGTTIVASILRNVQENILILESVTNLNEGNYTCTAENSFSSNKSLIYLTVFARVGLVTGVVPKKADLPLSNPQDEELTGSPLKKYVVPGVSVFVCVAMIALIVVIILIRRKRQKGRTGNNHAELYVNLSGDMTYAQVIRKSSKNIDGNKSNRDTNIPQSNIQIDGIKSIRDTNIPQSNIHIDGNKSIRDTDASQVYMNIQNVYAAVQQRSSTSNPNSYINKETESANKQVNKTEELNYIELEFSSNAQDENSSHGIRGSPSDTTYTEVVVFLKGPGQSLA